MLPPPPKSSGRCVTSRSLRRGSGIVEAAMIGSTCVRVRRVHVPNATLSLREIAGAIARPMSAAKAERRIAGRLGDGRHVVLFASARGAIAAAVSASGAATVAVPAYTCVATVNAVLSAGARPVYTDVGDQGLVPPDSWPPADLVLAQDTFGFVSAPPRDRAVVRDAAHRADLVLADGARVAVTSLEHSKWISAGQGGIAVTADDAVASALRAVRDRHRTGAGAARHGMVTLLTAVLGRLEYAGLSRLALPFAYGLAAVAADRMAGQSPGELAARPIPAELLGSPNGTVAALAVSQFAALD